MRIFSEPEMQRRLEGIRAGLVERDLDACFVHSPDNVYYASGVPLLSEWGRPMWLLVTAQGESALCGAMIEKENMERNSTVTQILTYGDEQNVTRGAFELCADFLKERISSNPRIGIEQEILPMGLYHGLSAEFPDAEFSDVLDLFSDMRIVKSDEELAILELGGQVAKIGADAFLEALHENATELAVAAHAVNAMDRALGALVDNAATSTYAYAQFGEHTLTPHLHPTTRRLQKNDVVGLNVFPVIWGYCAELERTFVFGKPDTQAAEALAAVNEAFDTAKAELGPGIRASEIERVSRAVLGRHGYADFIRHGTGHAHGIMIGAASREEPGELRIYNDRLLLPNMANSVEPGVYLPGVGGFRHSDVMFVTDTGSRCVTNFSRDITYGRSP